MSHCVFGCLFEMRVRAQTSEKSPPPVPYPNTRKLLSATVDVPPRFPTWLRPPEALSFHIEFVEAGDDPRPREKMRQLCEGQKSAYCC